MYFSHGSFIICVKKLPADYISNLLETSNGYLLIVMSLRLLMVCVIYAKPLHNTPLRNWSSRHMLPVVLPRVMFVRKFLGLFICLLWNYTFSFFQLQHCTLKIFFGYKVLSSKYKAIFNVVILVIFLKHIILIRKEKLKVQCYNKADFSKYNA